MRNGKEACYNLNSISYLTLHHTTPHYTLLTEGSDPKLITHIYHMIAAMDGVYEFLVEYHEDWRAGLRTWLLRYV
jgi:hypothetical protein